MSYYMLHKWPFSWSWLMQCELLVICMLSMKIYDSQRNNKLPSGAQILIICNFSLSLLFEVVVYHPWWCLSVICIRPSVYSSCISVSQKSLKYVCNTVCNLWDILRVIVSYDQICLVIYVECEEGLAISYFYGACAVVSAFGIGSFVMPVIIINQVSW